MSSLRSPNTLNKASESHCQDFLFHKICGAAGVCNVAVITCPCSAVLLAKHSQVQGTLAPIHHLNLSFLKQT